MALIKESQNYERGGTQKDQYTDEDLIVVSCPYCGSDRRKLVYREHGAIVVSQCQGCSLIYTSSRLKSPEAVYWGDQEKYYSEARLIFEGRAAHHRDPNYLEELALIRQFKPQGRFLDVGCNMGMLLRHVRRMGWTAVGVEPSPTLAPLAIKGFGLNVYNCFLNELPTIEHRSFDVIALSDVFEHISDPLSLLSDVRQLLAPDGILYVKVPNARWNLFKQSMLKLLGKAPKQGVWDSYEHVVHYTDRTLAMMLDKAGFAVKRMTFGKPIQLPAWQDYVGHYYQYPSPVMLDWRRRAGRSAFYWLAWPERLARGGSIGACAPNLVAVATATQVQDRK
jgi:2-polyprenyl-3-methyl-5-hydroxy-6-metoxy-1,4-benzoquinol methylase